MTRTRSLRLTSEDDGAGYHETRDIVPVEIPEEHAWTYPSMHRHPTCHVRLVMYERVTVTPWEEADADKRIQYVGIHSRVGKHWHFVTRARFVLVEERHKDLDGWRRLAVLDAVESLCIDTDGPVTTLHPRSLSFLYEVLALSPVPYRHVFRVSKALLADGGPFGPELARAMADDPELVVELPHNSAHPNPQNVFEFRVNSKAPLAPSDLVVRPRATWMMDEEKEDQEHAL